MLEKRIASILISEIQNYDIDEDQETDEKIHNISVKKVYAQLMTNNVVSIKHLAKKSTPNENRVYSKYKDSVKLAVAELKQQLNSKNGKVYNDLSKEYQKYYDYIYDILKNEGILLKYVIDTKD